MGRRNRGGRQSRIVGSAGGKRGLQFELDDQGVPHYEVTVQQMVKRRECELYKGVGEEHAGQRKQPG